MSRVRAARPTATSSSSSAFQGELVEASAGDLLDDLVDDGADED